MPEDGTPPARTIIGPTVVIKGKLKSNEDLIVNGRIEADISSTRDLNVATSGIIKANIEVQSAIVSGALVGNITGAQKVEITSEGRVVGDLSAPRVILRDGAAFKGKIAMQGFEAPQQLSAALEVESEPPRAPAGEATIPGAPAPKSVWELPPQDDRPKKRRF